MYAKRVLKLNREGWAIFKGVADDNELLIGYVREDDGQYQIESIWTTCLDTPANRAKYESVWKANSFAREVKVK